MSATSASGALRVSAPGKMMIAGEYAVLEGAEAVVAAVDRRALVTLTRDGTQAALPPEVSATRALIEARFGALPGAITLDVSALQQSGKKLGLGSSAAAAAATAGVLLHACGRDLADPNVRALALELALQGHRSVAPQGSGADVAASVLGGFVRFRRLGNGVETHALPWPSALHTVVVWTGEPARTNILVSKVQALAASDPRTHRRCMAALGAESERFISALMAGELSEIIECFHAFGTAMGALGTAAGVPIVDPTTARVRELARDAGGAAKPSGAGGGDVALALFSSADAANAFRHGCVSQQIEVLSLELGVPGERYEEQS
jgi:phosphomevalonate kinase